MPLYDSRPPRQVWWVLYNTYTMSYDRREFLKSLTLGGLALFTADWFKLVDETKATSAGKLLPAWPGDPIPSGHDVLNAVWQSGDGYALYLNGTPYDEPPTRTYRQKLEAAGEYDVIRALEKLGTGKYEGIDDVDLLDEEADGGREDETWREFIGRRAPTFLETLEYIEAEGLPSSSYKLDDDIDSDRDEGFVTAWCRNNAPEAAATGYLSSLLEGLRAEKDKVDIGDAIEAEGLRFVDGACPGNDTLVCAYANDYDTLCSLQRVLDALGRGCRIVILEANPSDAGKAG